MKLKSILKFGTLTIGFLMVVLLLCGSIFEKDMGKIILSQLDEQIHGSISYTDYSISLFKSFPNVEATFDEIVVKQGDKKVIDTDHFSIEIDVIKLIRKTVQINGITIESGDVHIVRNKAGKTNLELLFASENSDGEAQPINIEDVTLHDVHVRYQDLKTTDEYRLHVDNGDLSAKIKEEIIIVDVKGNGRIDFISIADLSYAEQQSFNIHGGIHVLRSQSLYQFKGIDVNVGKSTGHLTGSMKSLANGIKYDIEIRDVNSNINSLVLSLPKEYAKYIEAYDLDGKATGLIRVHGVKDMRTNPQVSITSVVTQGVIREKNTASELKGVSGKVTYHNGDKASLKSSILHASDMRTTWGDQDIQGNFVIQNFISPKADGSLKGELKLKAFQKYFDGIGINNMDGSIFIHHVDFNGLALSKRSSKTDGINELILNCSIRDVNFNCGKESIYVSNGDISLQEDELYISNANVLIGESDVHVDATVGGFVTGILQQNKIANLAVTVDSKRIDAKELWTWYLAIKDDGAKAVPVASSRTKKKPWYKQIRSSVKVSAKHIDYEKVQGDSFIGSIEQTDYNFKIKAKGESFSGEVEVDSKGRFFPQIVAETTISTTKSDVTSLFDQFDDFGQEFLRSDHLTGDMNVKSHIKCFWDKHGNLDKKNIELDAYFDVRNGELKDLEVLKQFSKYINIDELAKIKFSKMSNLIEVRKGEVFIPAMYIQNSACNMMISGMHSLDNQIHYNIKVNAGQAIGLKLKRNKESNKIIPARKDGWLNMYFNVNGTVDDFEYEANKSLVMRGFDFGETKKHLILDRLTKIFGPLEQFDEPLEWLDIPNYQDEDIEFIDAGEEYLNNF